MKSLIIGTSGHIDHGKTTLIKKITGIDTDTLPEEAKRGMTINLGFAYYTRENGERIGIIDVPGHEKFIKNMVAGASGIDFLLIVIACDDGIMPQTIEHVNICEMLGVKSGIIVLTKRDLCDEHRVTEIKSDILVEFKDSFLSKLPIVEVSEKNSETIENLKKVMEKELDKLQNNQKEENSFRLAVDRVFTVKGFGTVVTGTTISGRVSVGDTIKLYPKGTLHKVKGIQNHGINVQFLESGNRCALNLSGLECNDVKRGNIVSNDLELKVSKRIDGTFAPLNDKIEIKNNLRVRVLMGTSEIIGRMKLLSFEEIKYKKNNFVQIELEEDIVVLSGDIGVIRNYSPMSTIGKIEVLNVSGEKVKRGTKEYIKELEIISGGDNIEKLILTLKNDKKLLFSFNDLEKLYEKKVEVKELEILLDKEKLKKIILSTSENSKIVETELLYILNSEFEHQKNLVNEFVGKFHQMNRLKSGIKKSELKEKLYKKLELKEFNKLLEILLKEEIVRLDNNYITLSEFKIILTKDEKKIKDEILNQYKEKQFIPEKIERIQEKVEEKNFKEIHKYLVERGLLIALGNDYHIMRGFFVTCTDKLKEYLLEKEKITLSEYKEILNIGRKDALILLEKFDSLNITKRVDNYRVLN